MSPLLRQYQRRLLKSMFHIISKIIARNIDDCILLDNSAFVRITLNFTLK